MNHQLHASSPSAYGYTTATSQNQRISPYGGTMPHTPPQISYYDVIQPPSPGSPTTTHSNRNSPHIVHNNNNNNNTKVIMNGEQQNTSNMDRPTVVSLSS